MNPPLRIALAAIVAAPLFLTHAGGSLHRDTVGARRVDTLKYFGSRGKMSHTEAEAGGLGQP